MKINTDDPIFYVYIYLDSRKPGDYNYGEFHFDFKPFYVGKGKNKRIYSHLGCRPTEPNKYKKNIIKKILNENKTPVTIKLFENLYNIEACETEIFLIKQIGRRDLNLGPLTNLTDGGDGGKNQLCSEETRKKLSESHKGYHPSPESIRKSVETKIKNGTTGKGRTGWNKGLPMSIEAKKKSSDKKKGRSHEELYGVEESKRLRELLSLKNKGKKTSPQSIEKQIETKRKNNKLNITEETKQKISNTLLGHESSIERNYRIALNQPTRKPILQFTMTGDYIHEWRSNEQIIKTLGYGVSRNCKNKHTSVRGYIWVYKEDCYVGY